MKAVYIHIPFCNSICSYCDFCKMINNSEWAKNYLFSLKKEIEKYYERDTVKSIYIGGGTPSCLNMENLEILFDILNIFKTCEDFEFTFECNINDISSELLNLLRYNGVNRLSIGVESFDKNNLRFLNRKHDKKDIASKIELCKKYGFNNINVDLIYALPFESMYTLRSDISKLLKLDIQHISTYSLIIEDNTALYIKNIKSIDEETDYKMYKYICKKLRKNDFVHYEVSNFAKDGHMSKHNLTYWDNLEYYGFGLGAHGYINSIRYENTRGLNKYLDGDYRLNELLVSTQEEMENELILGLRKLKGVNIKKFYEKYDVKIEKVFKLKEALEKGYLILNGNYLSIPEDKIYVMNEIINMIM